MQPHFDIPAWDAVKCRYCHAFRPWNDGRGWNGRKCPQCLHDEYMADRERRLEMSAKWREANPDYQREYDKNNREKINASRRRHYYKNHEVMKAKGRASYAANPEKYKEAARRWAQENPERVKELDRLYYERNRDRISEYNRLYYERNRDRISEYNRDYYAGRQEELSERHRQYMRDNPEVHRKSAINRRARQLEAICEHGPGCFANAVATMPQRCVNCKSKKNIAADHIQPLAKGGLDCYLNQQPLCFTCNSSKHAGDPIAFARRNGRLF